MRLQHKLANIWGLFQPLMTCAYNILIPQKDVLLDTNSPAVIAPTLKSSLLKLWLMDFKGRLFEVVSLLSYPFAKSWKLKKKKKALSTQFNVGHMPGNSMMQVASFK